MVVSIRCSLSKTASGCSWPFELLMAPNGLHPSGRQRWRQVVVVMVVVVVLVVAN